MNKAERWHRISALFDRVVELPAPEREAVLAAECADDPQLRTEVERLLQADERTNPVDQDIAGQASTLLLEGDPHEHEGQQFGPYRIVKLLAQGGMGRVYLAERQGEDFAQTVALKLVGGYGSFDAYTARRRFLDERRILARLQHPNIARLLDGGVGPEAQPWFAMEYVDGAPLTDWCDAQRLDVRQRLNLFAKVCEAVDHAHRFLIVHRDLKPGNVLVDHRGEPKVLDFGIAKLLDEGAAERTGSTILMTPDYAAPEQIRGGQISTATDVYALGAVLFELLTGRKPFCDPMAPRDAPQASRVATEGKHTGERAQARATTPQALRKQLRGDVDRILRTALDPDPARRYRSAERLAQDLRAVADGRAISLRSDRTYRMGIFFRRHKWETAAAAAAVLGLLGTTGWALWQTQQAYRHALEEARQAEIAKKETLAAEKVSNLLISAFDAATPVMRKTKDEPTAKDVLDAGAASIDKELADAPEVKARMRLVLGRAYMNLRKTEPARQLLQAAIDDYLGKEVNNPAEAMEAMHLLAVNEINSNHIERSIALSRQVLATHKRIGSPVTDIIEGYNVLALALIRPGHYDEAVRVFDEYRDIVKKGAGDPSREVAAWLNNRGRLATMMGRMREADRLFRETTAMKIVIKENEKSFYRTRGMRAVVLAEMGRFAEAQKDFSKNYGQAAALYGKNSMSQALVRGRQGDAYWRQGNWLLAQAAYEEAAAIAGRAEDASNGEVGVHLNHLAEVQEARGLMAEAGRNYALAQEILSEAFAPAEVENLRAQADLRMHKLRGAGIVSSDELESALAAWRGVYGKRDASVPPDLADALFMETEYRLALGRIEGLESMLPAADATLEQPMMQARREYLLARINAQRGDRTAALAGHERAIAIADTAAGRESAWAALWRLDYAEQLAAAGRRHEAKAQLAIATPVLKAQLAPHAPAFARLQRLLRAVA